MAGLLKSGALADVTILLIDEDSVETELPAHAAILASASEPMAALFGGEAFAEARERVVRMQEFPASVTRQLLHFCYAGTVELTPIGCVPVLAAADMYGVEGLRNLCVEFLRGHLDVNRACELLEVGRQYSCDELVEDCEALILRKAAAVFSSEDADEWDRGGVCALSQESLLSLLRRDELQLEEELILDAVLRWGRYRLCTGQAAAAAATAERRGEAEEGKEEAGQAGQLSELGRLLQPLLQEVRLSQLPPSVLYSVVAPLRLVSHVRLRTALFAQLARLSGGSWFDADKLPVARKLLPRPRSRRQKWNVRLSSDLIKFDADVAVKLRSSRRRAVIGYAITTGQHYVQVRLQRTTARYIMVGVAALNSVSSRMPPMDSTALAMTAASGDGGERRGSSADVHKCACWVFNCRDGCKRAAGQSAAYARAVEQGSAVGMLLDSDKGTLQFFVDGSLVGTAFTELKAADVGPLWFIVDLMDNGDAVRLEGDARRPLYGGSAVAVGV
eukprot:PLAT3483.1.p1 GENE.PLAT3483.1~~PLAT3483.1.p1  ORF type:complete len:534 (-),score=191.73 PLAT3483.1:18-1526(-)